MSNYYYQPNGDPQNGHPNQYGRSVPPPPPSNDLHQYLTQVPQVPPYASLGSATNTGLTTGQNSAYAYSGQHAAAAHAGGQNANAYAGGQNANQYSTAPPPYSTLGGGGSQMYPGPYGSMAASHANANNFSHMAASSHSAASHWSGASHQQPQQYHQHGSLGHSYNQSTQQPPPPPPPSYSSIPHMLQSDVNSSTTSSNIFTRQQQHHLPSAAPLPAASYMPPAASYSNSMQAEIEASARTERIGTREEIPKAGRNSPIPPPMESLGDPSTTTDNAVHAINALSRLQNRWLAPAAAGENRKEGSQKTKKRARRRANRRKKKNAGNNGVGSSKDPIVLDNADEWIDVIHAPTKKQAGKKEFDLASNVGEKNFPPLVASHTSSLEDMSTSHLKSYAAVLGRALDKQNDGSTYPGDNYDGEEMDISDDDEEEEECKSGEMKPNPNLDEPKQDILLIENEKRALKLAELRAKAKLARAKLRMAEQKKARGNVATRESSSPMAVPATSLNDITALRNVGSLVIDDVALTGPADEIRFVDSVYGLQPESDRDSARGSRIIDLTNVRANEMNPQPAKEERQLQLARLQKQQLQLAIEIKKKELRKKEIEMKKKEALSVTVDNETSLTEQIFGTTSLLNPDGELENAQDDKPDDSTKDHENVDTYDQAQEKLDQLRRRQKELKQRNEIANLRNMIHRQRDLLQAQGQELSESSTQLQACVDGIRTNQQLLDESEQRLGEMNHRKRIMEGMVLRATEQLIAARKALSERRQQNE